MPTQVLLHLGGMINMRRVLVCPPLVQVDTLLQALQELLRLTVVHMSARAFIRVTGLIASCHALIPLCLFHLRPVSIHLVDHYDLRSDPLVKPIPLNSPVLLAALEFCAELPRVAQGVLLHRPLPTVTLAMDVSSSVWTPLKQWCLNERPNSTPHKLFGVNLQSSSP